VPVDSSRQRTRLDLVRDNGQQISSTSGGAQHGGWSSLLLTFRAAPATVTRVNIVMEDRRIFAAESVEQERLHHRGHLFPPPQAFTVLLSVIRRQPR